jgi:hypothetical protein
VYRPVEALSITHLAPCTCQEHEGVPAEPSATIILQGFLKQSGRTWIAATLPQLIAVEIQSASVKGRVPQPRRQVERTLGPMRGNAQLLFRQDITQGRSEYKASLSEQN